MRKSKVCSFTPKIEIIFRIYFKHFDRPFGKIIPSELKLFLLLLKMRIGSFSNDDGDLDENDTKQ